VSSSVLSLPFTRVLTSPAASVDQQEQPLRRAILAGLLDSGVRGAPAASLWIRPAPWAPLQILIAGALTSVPPEDPPSRSRPLLFPLGATGAPVGRVELEKLLALFPWWTGCAGNFEPLLRDTEEQATKTEERWSASPLDDVAGYLSHQAFAWLVVCAPVPQAEVRGELETLRRRLFRLHQSGHLSETDTLDLERSQAWFRELSRAGNGGVWDVAIAVGTADAAMGLPLASILCTAAERSVSLYKFRPSPDGPLPCADDAVLARSDNSDASEGEIPFRATADLAAALVRPPEAELPGLRLVAAPSFDTTLDFDSGLGDQVELGVILDRFLRPAGPLTVSLETLNRHTFVCGATGGGKSQTVRGLLEALSRRTPALPWLVIEPAKAEYARMAGRLAGLSSLDVLVIAPGDPHAPPASMNPLEPASLEPGNPARTFPLQSHADLVRALFMAAFHADEPFPQVLSRALTGCYEAAGWDLVTGEPLLSWDRVSGQPTPGAAERSLPRYPSLASLQQMAQRVVEEIGYGEDIKKNVRGFVDVRIGSLRLGTPGRFFEGGHPLDIAAALRRNVVIEIEGITNDQDKAFVMGALLIRLYEQLLLEEKERFAAERTACHLRHVTVIEEAHRLLRNVPADSPAAHSLELFASLLAEVRAYGEGIIVAEQIPSKLIPDILKNTALKVVHRLPAADDRDAVGATMNLSEAQSQYVVTLAPGSAAIFADGMDRPLLAAMRAGEDRENAGPATRLPPVGAGKRRSRSCGAQCRTGEPCTLSTIRHAERLLQAHPELTFWMEVSFAAHGVGFPAPTLADSRAVAELRQRGQQDPRLVECTIAHAAEEAIQPRYDGLKSFFDPQALGEHLTDIATNMLLGTGGGGNCSDDRGRWRVGLQRIADITHWMELLSRGSAVPHSHEELIRRASERGVDLGTGDPGAQLGYLSSLPWGHLKGDRQRALLVGDLTAPRLVAAAAALVGPGDPHDQIAGASSRTLIWDRVTHPEQLLPQLCPPRPSATEPAK
jgi:uncharacterized protein